MAGQLAKLILLLALVGRCQVSAVSGDETTATTAPVTGPATAPVTGPAAAPVTGPVTAPVTGLASTPATSTTTVPSTATVTTPPPPVKPTGLTVTSRTTNSLTVSWNGTASYYEVRHRKVDGAFDNSTRINVTSAQISALAPGQTYEIQVTAYNEMEGGPGSGSVNLTTTTKPNAPTWLRVVSGGSTNVTLTWTAPSNSKVDKYRVHWSSTVVGGRSGNKETTSNKTTLTINTLTTGYSYNIHVVAVTASNINSDSSEAVNYTAKPNAPTGLHVISGGSAGVTIKWTAPSNSTVDKYRVHWNSTVVGGGNGNNETTSNETTLTINTLTPGYSYNVHVVSVTASNINSDSSETVEYTAAPSPVAGLNLTVNASDFLTFEWNDGSGRYDDVEFLFIGPNSEKAKQTNNTNTVTYSDLLADETYMFSVRTSVVEIVNKTNKYSEYENITSTTMEASSGPVDNLTVTDRTNDSISILWSSPQQPNGDIIGYVILAKLTGMEECSRSVFVNCTDCDKKAYDYINERILNLTSTCTSQADEYPITNSTSPIKYTMEMLVPFTRYTLEVYAINTQEPNNATVNNQTLETVPSEKPVVTIVDFTHDEIRINWRAVSNDSGVITDYYASVRFKNGSAVQEVKVNPGSALQHNFTGLTPYTNYVIKVFASNGEYNGTSNLYEKRTGQYIPGPVTKLTVETGVRFLSVTWGEPSLLNGVIQQYHVIIKDSKGNQIYQSSVTSDTKTVNVTENIKPYTSYTVSVRAKTEYETWGNFSTNWTRTLQTTLERKSSISPETRAQWFNEETGISTDHITFTLTDQITDIFSLDNGKITKYQVLVVAQAYADPNTLPKGTTNTPLNWADVQKDENKGKPYAIHVELDPPNAWNKLHKKKRAVAVDTVTVGAEECNPSSSVYCNGPLKSSTDYCIFLRVQTSAGYTDSVCLVTAKTKLDIVPIVIAVVASVAVLIILLAVVYVLYKKGKLHEIVERTRGKRQCNDDDGLKAAPDAQMAIFEPDPPPPKEIHLEDFIDHTNEMHKDQDFRFSQEYQKLRDLSAKHVNHAAVMGANTSKNRWVDILPFDHSRVKLLPADEEEGSDYINANYMPGYTSRREYIATQGPLPGTIDHFWRMIWEQNVSMIVMLTQLVERGRRKCEQYWPDDLEEPATYGDLVVTKRSESILPEYTIRIFDIQMGEITRSVEQFFVSFWPDFGCPDNVSSLLNLVRVVRSHMRPESRGPLVVHCSAGVGRTGTYMAVDRLLQHIQEYDALDIFNMVLEMREYRCKMVQTEDQYIYIHDCIKEALLTGMSVRYTPDPSANNAKADDPIYENAGQALNGVDTEMVAVKMNGDDPTHPIIKNTEL